MQHFEPPVRPLATQGDLIKHKRRGQVRQIALYLIGPYGDLRLGQRSRQGQVEPKFFHDVGIAPLHQQCVLPRAQPGRATARQFRCIGRSPKCIEFGNASLRNSLDGLRSAQWGQRQKPTLGYQFHRIAHRRGKRCRKVRCLFFQISEHARVDQPKRRFQRAVEPIFARCHRDVTQTGHILLAHLMAMHKIPTEPSRAKFGQ